MAQKAANFMLGLILVTGNAASLAGDKAAHWYTPWRRAPAPAAAPAAASPSSAAPMAATPARPRHWYTPWRKPPAPPPVPVHELDISSGGAPAGTGAAVTVLQFWNRNNLRVDLTGQAGSGALELRPAAGGSWPVRLEFAVRPGSMAQLEVRGEKRVVFNVPAAASADGAPQILELGVGVYTLQTPALTLSWQ